MWDQGVDSISATLQIGLGGIILFIYLFTTTPNDPKVPDCGVINGSKTAPKRSSNM